MKTIILFYSENDIDFLGNVITKDRYIILDKSGFDIYGEHFSLEDAKKLIN